MLRPAAIAAAAALAVAAPYAQAAPAESVQALAERSEAWIERTLRVEIPDRPVSEGPPAVMADCGGVAAAYGHDKGCAGLAYPDRILLDRATFRGIRALAGGSWWPWFSHHPYALLHEQLHHVDDREWADEGINDAVAWDLYPAWSRAMFGFRLHAPRIARADVQVVRKASALATGGTWRTREARMIRRHWRALPRAERHAAIAATFDSKGDQ